MTYSRVLEVIFRINIRHLELSATLFDKLIVPRVLLGSLIDIIKL